MIIVHDVALWLGLIAPSVAPPKKTEPGEESTAIGTLRRAPRAGQGLHIREGLVTYGTDGTDGTGSLGIGSTIEGNPIANCQHHK